MIIKINGKDVHEAHLQEIQEAKKQFEVAMLIVQGVLLAIDAVCFLYAGHPALTSFAFTLVEKAVAI